MPQRFLAKSAKNCASTQGESDIGKLVELFAAEGIPRALREVAAADQNESLITKDF